MRGRDKRTATKNVRFWCFIVEEKIPKTFGGGQLAPPPPALIRPRVKLEFPALNVNSGEEREKTAVLAG